MPVYGCLRIRECKVDASLPGQLRSRESATPVGIVPTDLWVGLNSLFLAVAAETSTVSSIETSIDSGLSSAAVSRFSFSLYCLIVV